MTSRALIFIFGSCLWILARADWYYYGIRQGRRQTTTMQVQASLRANREKPESYGQLPFSPSVTFCTDTFSSMLLNCCLSAGEWMLLATQVASFSLHIFTLLSILLAFLLVYTDGYTCTYIIYPTTHDAYEKLLHFSAMVSTTAFLVFHLEVHTYYHILATWLRTYVGFLSCQAWSACMQLLRSVPGSIYRSPWPM